MSRPVTVFVISRMRSASVDFPWSMWAMIEKLRMCAWSTTHYRVGRAARASAARPRQPCGERVADLASLGHVQREHGEAVGREADRQRAADRDQLARQRATDELVQAAV